MIAFIDAHRTRFGVEPICRVLREHGCGIAPNTYWAARKRPPSKRSLRDAELVGEVHRVYEENLLCTAPTRSGPSSTGRTSASPAAPSND